MSRYTIAQVAPDHWQWMSDRSGVTLTADFSAVAALDPDRIEQCGICGQEHPAIRGMVGYSDTTPSATYMHIALEHPVAYRALRKVALPLAFEVANKEIVFGQVRASNKRVRRLMEHEGFRQVVVLQGAFHATDDLIIYRLDRADWRARHGREG